MLLNSAIGSIAPIDKLRGRDKHIFKDRDSKLEAAGKARRIKRRHQKQTAEHERQIIPIPTEALQKEVHHVCKLHQTNYG